MNRRVRASLAAILAIGLLFGTSLGTFGDEKHSDEKSKVQAIAKELDDLQGSWSMIAIEYDGRRVRNIPDIRWTIAKNRLKINQGADEQTIRLDPTAQPKAIDLISKDGASRQGIYELDGDELKIAFGRMDTQRPSSFGPELFSPAEVVWILKRTMRHGHARP